MSQTVEGWDAAFIPRVPPAAPGFQFAEVYVGGSSAFRVAPDDELARVAHLPVLPIWVPTPGLDNPAQTAMAAAARLEALGIPRYAKPYRAMMLDLETGIEPDPPWVSAFAARFVSQGYDTIPYGSPSTIFRQPQRLGYAVASPTGRPHMYPHAGVILTQWAFDVPMGGVLVDLDQAEAWLMNHLGGLNFTHAALLEGPPEAPAAGPAPLPGLPGWRDDVTGLISGPVADDTPADPRLAPPPGSAGGSL
jgi:hypothetical protein